MKKLKDVQPVVEFFLKNNKATRSDDSLLYAKVCETFNSDISLLPFSIVLENRADFGIPCFETVRRTRQKLQADFDELKPTKGVQVRREEAEKEFRDYALQ